MKDVAILTKYYKNYNYGGMLQGYALHKVITDLGYSCAGVLLINLEELRKLDVNNLIKIYVNKYIKLINYADQDILNGMFKDRIGELAPQFDVMTIDVVHSYEEIKKLRKPTNYYSREQLQFAVNRPVIIHYTTNMLAIRPWFSNTDHPFAGEFKKYMDMSTWKNRELKEMVFDSKVAKVIKAIMILPKGIAYKALGLIHAELKPKYISMRAGK